MEFTPLGWDGTLISRLGFGCSAASGYDCGPIDSKAWVCAVQAAVDYGLNFFDVADVYGLGRVEKMLCEALGRKRHQVVVATKGGLVWDERGVTRRDASPAQIRRAVDNSLRNLRLETIPLYQVHWPDPVTPIEDTLGALLDLRRVGKIRMFGVSNFPLESLRRIQVMTPFESLQVPYNLLCREVEEQTLAWCAAQKVSVIAHSGLARGVLACKRRSGDPFNGLDSRSRSPYFAVDPSGQKQHLLDAIREICDRTGGSCVSVALRWVLDNPGISTVLVGIKTITQLNESMGALDWSLTESDRALLTSLSSYCQGALQGEPIHGPVSSDL